MKLIVPELSLVLIVGASGSGKSTFAHRHFLPTEILSSDVCRGLASDDENDQSVTNQAFEILHFIASKRLELGKMTVVDATNVRPEDRKHFVELARRYHCLPVAIVLNLPERLCAERNQTRANRQFASHVIRHQVQSLRRSLRGLAREGFRHIHILASEEEIAAAEIVRQPLWNNRKHEHGPFDIIGDVHGCCDELEKLLRELGYVADNAADGASGSPFWSFPTYRHPAGRKAIFLGDLVDRGPRSLDVLRLARNMVVAGAALCVPGNHDLKLLKKLNGKNVTVNHGLERTLSEIDALPEALREEATRAMKVFLDGLVSHYVLDDGKLVVAHAGMKEAFQGRGSGRVRDFALYGETTGEIDAFGLPVRHNWASEYRGRALVVYGHTPAPEPEWLNNTINIDSGCVFGGRLTALRYPEKELLSVPAAQTYCEPIKPLAPPVGEPSLDAQQQHDDLLNLADVSGKRVIATRYQSNVIIREGNAAAALEAMSRFAANPKWLIYLPPTMSPVATAPDSDLLERPEEAFAYYKERGVSTVICEEKHMGSRAIVIVCRDETVAKTRFGVVNEGAGVCYTRTGRRFFNTPEQDAEIIARVSAALSASGFWETLDTDWACLDCELMPWSAKAQSLLQQQYAPVGAAARRSLAESLTLLERAAERQPEASALAAHHRMRLELAHRYVDAYRRYCWPVNSVADLRLAPFHILATEGAVHVDKTHVWHMERIAAICEADPSLLLATNHLIVDLNDPESERAAAQWWCDLTTSGGEGMVVKPTDFIAKNAKGLLQPAVKCRGPEYLRIIYGPEYSLPEHVERLRQRGLSSKRSLALREFALGLEALHRFVDRAPLRRVHECVFGVLALESEPVDPRL
jgi:protein phosphatase